MTFMDSIVTCFTKYATFSGRARRSEFWFFSLFTYVVSLVLSLIAEAIPFLAILGSLFALATLIPGLAVTWRRLHDVGRSGAWWLLCLTGIGAIVVLVFCCMDSKPGDNLYGPNPKHGSSSGYSEPVRYTPPASDPWDVPSAPKAPAADEDDEFAKALKAFKDSEQK